MKFNKMQLFKSIIVMLGIVLSMLTELYGGYTGIWPILWALFPYMAYCLASLKLKSNGAIISGGLFILGTEILIRIQIFYFPESSTDSLILLTAPFWESIIIMPIGFLFGLVIEKLINRKKIGTLC